MLVNALLLLVGTMDARPPLAHVADTTRQATEVSGAVTVTNKGISLIPSFSLGKPATLVELDLERQRLGFEPQFRVGLDGKPWSFVFWGRYRPATGQRLHLTLGTHPALLFHSASVIVGGQPHTVLTANRYWAGEVSPAFTITKNLSAGPYYLYSRGLDRDAVRNTNFVSLRANLTVPLATNYVAVITPQGFYLRQDTRDGTYVNGAVTVGKRGLPLSVSAMANKTLHTTLPTQDLLWNVSLTYTIR